MKKFLGRFFAELPIESQDQAHITHLLLVFIMILEVICRILAVLFLFLHTNAIASAITILATMFLIGLHVQIHRGYRQLVSWTLPALIFAALVFAIFNYGSLRVSSLLGFATNFNSQRARDWRKRTLRFWRFVRYWNNQFVLDGG